MLGPYQWYHEPNPRHFTISCWYCWLFKHWILQSVGVSLVSCVSNCYQPLAARFFWPLCSEEAKDEEDRKGDVEVVKVATSEKMLACWDIWYMFIRIYIYDICVLLNLMCKTSYKQPSCPYIPFSNLFSKIDARSDTLTLCIGWLMEIWWLHPSGRLPMCAPPKLSVLLAMFGDAGTGRDGATPWCQAWDVDPSFRSLR